MLGNAVPSLLAEVMAREISGQLLDRRPPADGPVLMPPVRRPIPAPEPLAPLPEKYWSMIGDHADHPGEGRGYRSTGRGQAPPLAAKAREG
jgi:DNA (cytosine-5)-methyltransferase 1